MFSRGGVIQPTDFNFSRGASFPAVAGAIAVSGLPTDAGVFAVVAVRDFFDVSAAAVDPDFVDNLAAVDVSDVLAVEFVPFLLASPLFLAFLLCLVHLLLLRVPSVPLQWLSYGFFAAMTLLLLLTSLLCCC
jgi:hypothetical protein